MRTMHDEDRRNAYYQGLLDGLFFGFVVGVSLWFFGQMIMERLA